MKLACILAVVLNLVLLAAAGYRLYDVDNDEVSDWKQSMTTALSEHVLSEMDAQLAAEGMTWDDVAMPGVEDEPGAATGDSSYQWGKISEENITDFSEGDPFADDTQAERQEDLNSAKDKIRGTFSK